MALHQTTLTIRTAGQGLHDVSEAVAREVARAKIARGIATIFCQHTSCSLVIMENADPTARRDLEAWFERLVPENDPHFEHTMEGPDDICRVISKWRSPAPARRCRSAMGKCCSEPGRASICGNTGGQRTRGVSLSR
jgi:hypothetical protein